MRLHQIIAVTATLFFLPSSFAADYAMSPTQADKKWLLPKTPPYPADNKPNPARVELGKMLFFDPRLSSEGNMSCATCHNPVFGWSDGLPTGKGFHSKVLGRASPTVVNTGYNTIQMWDGRKASLEDQAMGPMQSSDEMAMNLETLFSWLNSNPTYQQKFAKAYPGEEIAPPSASKAIAAFERTLVSNDSPFDRWLKGNKKALSKEQILGFRLFEDPKKGNCAICHQAPNFTNNGFHNIGLASYDQSTADMGRFTIKPLPSLKGAFKTPTLREIDQTAPYFHDGSSKTLEEVVAHYNKGGITRQDLSPDIKPLNLSEDEQKALVAFMHALTSAHKPVTLPKLPPN